MLERKFTKIGGQLVNGGGGPHCDFGPKFQYSYGPRPSPRAVPSKRAVNGRHRHSIVWRRWPPTRFSKTCSSQLASDKTCGACSRVHIFFRSCFEAVYMSMYM